MIAYVHFKKFVTSELCGFRKSNNYISVGVGIWERMHARMIEVRFLQVLIAVSYAQDSDALSKCIALVQCCERYLKENAYCHMCAIHSLTFY